MNGFDMNSDDLCDVSCMVKVMGRKGSNGIGKDDHADYEL